MSRSIQEKIVDHVCYRDVFNSPVCIESLKTWIGIGSEQLSDFERSIDSLKDQQLIVEQDGLIAVYPKYDIIDSQDEKNKLTEHLIEKGSKFLHALSKLPLIKYIGISGSLAANNPTIGSKGVNKGTVDMDLFVISSANSLWILFLFERVITNVRRLFFGHHFYCFNYVTDETFLEVYNKNLYTATELFNLRTVYDSEIYDQFMFKNEWFKEYYPNVVLNKNNSARGSSLLSLLLAPFNYVCFVLFCFGRALKRFDWDPLLEIFGGFNPVQKCNLKRISNPNGGYQEAIKNRFKELYKSNFSQYYSEQVLEHLFPASHSFQTSEDNVHDLENAALFTKYSLSQNEKNTI